MPPDRPVKLTFPSYDIGAAAIMAGDLQVGHVLGEYWCWRAWLWPVADEFTTGPSGEQVTGRRLADLREKLRERVAENGPWWKAVVLEPDGEDESGDELPVPPLRQRDAVPDVLGWPGVVLPCL